MNSHLSKGMDDIDKMIHDCTIVRNWTLPGEIFEDLELLEAPNYEREQPDQTQIDSGGSCGNSNVDMKYLEVDTRGDVKKERTKRKNRESAKRSRENKKQKFIELKKENTRLEKIRVQYEKDIKGHTATLRTMMMTQLSLSLICPHPQSRDLDIVRPTYSTQDPVQKQLATSSWDCGTSGQRLISNEQSGALAIVSTTNESDNQSGYHSNGVGERDRQSLHPGSGIAGQPTETEKRYEQYQDLSDLWAVLKEEEEKNFNNADDQLDSRQPNLNLSPSSSFVHGNGNGENNNWPTPGLHPFEFQTSGDGYNNKNVVNNDGQAFNNIINHRNQASLSLSDGESMQVANYFAEEDIRMYASSEGSQELSSLEWTNQSDCVEIIPNSQVNASVSPVTSVHQAINRSTTFSEHDENDCYKTQPTNQQMGNASRNVNTFAWHVNQNNDDAKEIKDMDLFKSSK